MEDTVYLFSSILHGAPSTILRALWWAFVNMLSAASMFWLAYEIHHWRRTTGSQDFWDDVSLIFMVFLVANGLLHLALATLVPIVPLWFLIAVMTPAALMSGATAVTVLYGRPHIQRLLIRLRQDQFSDLMGDEERWNTSRQS